VALKDSVLPPWPHETEARGQQSVSCLSVIVGHFVRCQAEIGRAWFHVIGRSLAMVVERFSVAWAFLTRVVAGCQETLTWMESEVMNWFEIGDIRDNAWHFCRMPDNRCVWVCLSRNNANGGLIPPTRS